MRITTENTDAAVLEELGRRLSQARLAANMTQADLGREAGVSLATIKRVELGQSGNLHSFVRILRALRLLEALDALTPEVSPSPIELIEMSRRSRRRATGSRRTTGTPDRVGETPWRWGDE